MMTFDGAVSRFIPNARVQAFRHPVVAPPPIGFNGGVVLGDTGDDAKLRHTRYWQPADRFMDALAFDHRIDGEYIYFGPVYSHFGHVMAEMVHRVVPSMPMLKGRRLLMVAALDDGRINRVQDLPAFLIDLLSLWEIRTTDVTVLTRDTIVSSLFIHEQGSDFGGGPKPGYLGCLNELATERLDRVVGRPWRTGSRLYVSRRKVRSGGNILGEAYLERAFAESGFEIFHPEDYPILYQMQRYRSADVIVLAEGSACHGVELLGERSLHHCCILERRPDHREIFRRVLEPRAQSFARFEATIPVGTAVLHPDTGEKLSNFGVSVLDLRQFAGFLAATGIRLAAPLRNSDYADAARAELQDYITYHVEAGSRLVPPHELRALGDTLTRALNTGNQG